MEQGRPLEDGQEEDNNLVLTPTAVKRIAILMQC